MANNIWLKCVEQGKSLAVLRCTWEFVESHCTVETYPDNLRNKDQIGHSMYTHTDIQVVDSLQAPGLHPNPDSTGSQVWYPQWEHPRRLKPTLPPGSLMKL